MRPITSSFQTFLETRLNPTQRKAVVQKNGSLLVVAGAGSGKTRVITARIAYLILNEGVSPRSIIALTFTNKAAKEMHDRIAMFLGEEENIPFIGTFHGYCLRLLKKNSHLLPSPFVTILDDQDQQTLLSKILGRSGDGEKKITAKQVSYQISQLKNQLAQPTVDSFDNPLLFDIYKAYEHEKRLSRALDFDDLLLETLNLFRNNPAFKMDFQQKVRHILVDEYQDTNLVQHALLKQMAIDSSGTVSVDSICAVGDEDQSIYSWRGATVQNIMNFSKDFPNTTMIKVEQNYRTVQPILELANSLIAHNKMRNPKKLWSERLGRDRVRTITTISEYQEAEVISHFLRIARQQLAPSIAILYRAHFQSRVIEEALIKQSIPYKIIGGVQFYERKEIKDLLAYLRLVVNPYDRTAFFRIINYPLRGFGPKFEETFHDLWDQEPLLSFSELAKKLIDDKKIAGTKKTMLSDFVQMYDGIKPEDTPGSLINHLLTATEYMSYTRKNYDQQEAQMRLDNIKELLRAIEHFEEQGIKTLAGFLDEVALLQAKHNEDYTAANPVLLMTLHAAKGLEFDMVIIPGLEDGILPSNRSTASPEALEEERRLLYVGITRAKDRLLLTHSRYRTTYGSTTDCSVSRFVYELPETLIQRNDVSYWAKPQILELFAEWFDIKAAITSTTVHHAIKPGKPQAINHHKPLREYQTIRHVQFGVGFIQKIQPRGQSSIAEVKFKSGVKKIDTRFLEPL